MSIDRALLARYLRQRMELGEKELFLDRVTEAQMRRVLAGLPVPEWDAGAAEAAPPTGATPDAIGDIRPASANADALHALEREILQSCCCGLGATRTKGVPGEGNPAADVVVVGEAPGAEEDRTGRPFVGPAGKLLDLMLLSIGLPRSQVYICNVLKCRPPNNRDPQADEIAACTPFLHRQIELIAPRVLLAVGKFAAQTLAQSDAPIGKLRGRVHTYRGVPVVASYHPAFLLRSPQAIRNAWQDLQLLRQVLDEQG